LSKKVLTFTALELYEKSDEIKNMENAKIDEINRMSNILQDISNVENIDKDNYQYLYNHLLEQIKVKYLDNNFIDDKINNYVVKILNDIFNYYLYGNKEIPIDM
jgi:hypothetical protein